MFDAPLSPLLRDHPRLFAAFLGFIPAVCLRAGSNLTREMKDGDRRGRARAATQRQPEAGAWTTAKSK
jgi:hypothetical protein